MSKPDALLRAALVLALPLFACSQTGDNQEANTQAPGALQLAAESAPAPGGSQQPTQQQAIAAAREALSTLAQLEGRQSTGILATPPGLAPELTLADPLPLYLVRLDSLRAYNVTKNARSILVDARRLIFPVRNRGEVRTALTMERGEERWELVSFGRFDIEGIVSAQAEVAGPPVRGLFVVLVPALNDLTFVGYSEANSFMLVSVRDRREVDLSAGTVLAANVVFERLARLAVAIDPSVPR